MTATLNNNTIIIRLKLSPVVALSHVINIINQLQGDIRGIDTISTDDDSVIRDITLSANDQSHIDSVLDRLKAKQGVEIVNVSDRTFLIHLGGKITINSKIAVTNRDQLSMAYTPGVARVCMAIYNDLQKVHNLTIKRNTVAIVSDGSAVLGLGNIGPEAALPVMEGKAMLFKDFANINAFPICLATQEVDEIVATVKNIAPVFGGINLEDISSPRCFEIEKRLKAALNIPVFHDDQHGTAIVMAAGFINALRLTKRKPQQLKVIVNGVGAAGVACTKILLKLGVSNIIGCDRHGAITSNRHDLTKIKQYYASISNPYHESGTLAEVLKGADVFIGLSGPKLVTSCDIQHMNKDPIIFAMANPIPEIMPEQAKPYAAIVATGRSDYPNQINNVLAFPGVFRGVFDCHASDINEEMKVAAAYAIANTIAANALAADYIVPSVFDKHVAQAVAKAVKQKAIETGVARK